MPVGAEGENTYRSLRHLAERLAAAGSPVLRFDYHGTGDSSGGESDQSSIRPWLESVGSAIDYLKSLTKREHVTLFGVRIGALLATTAALQRSDVNRLALFAPITKGRVFIREITALSRFTTEHRLHSPQAAPSDASGFTLSPETQDELNALNLFADAGRRDLVSEGSTPRTALREALIISRDDFPGSDEELARFLGAIGVTVGRREIPGYAAMMSGPCEARRMPEQVLDAMFLWLTGNNPNGNRIVRYVNSAPSWVPPDQATAVRFYDNDFARTCETPIELAIRGGRRLFAVLTTPPHSTARDDRPLLVFLPTGLCTRIGQGRMWVPLARALAEHGFRSVRVDFPGLGDSLPAPGDPENKWYAANVINDTVSALESLARRTGAKQVVPIGLCSSAYVAYHMALRSRLVSAMVLINPPPFYWRASRPYRIFQRASDFTRALAYPRLTQPKQWYRALAQRSLYGPLLRNAFRAVANAPVAAIGLLHQNIAELLEYESALSRGHRQLSARGIDGLIVFSGDDPGFAAASVRSASLGPNLRQLNRIPGLRAAVIDDADHVFSQPAARHRLSAELTRFLLSQRTLNQKSRAIPARSPPREAPSRIQADRP